MRLGILVNLLDSKEPGQTTFRIAAEAARRGHEVWVTSAGNLAYETDDRVRAYARTVSASPRISIDKYLQAFRQPQAINRWIDLEELDVLLLRSNPVAQRPWAQQAATHFARLAMRRGVVVLSDPNGLAKAANKLYLNTYPQEVRPTTLVTRDLAKVLDLLEQHQQIVLKPLSGYGGKGVFLVEQRNIDNLPQIFESITRDGYAIAQQYLSEAAAGDTRLFLMNGLPLVRDRKYAAVRRIRTGDDMRSNIHSGGRIRRAEVDEAMLRVAEIVRPRLVEDGMFLVGLDIVGSKLMEINVFSPGGFGSIHKLTGVDFTKAVVDSIERKVDYSTYYQRNFSNSEICTL